MFLLVSVLHSATFCKQIREMIFTKTMVMGTHVQIIARKQQVRTNIAVVTGRGTNGGGRVTVGAQAAGITSSRVFVATFLT